ncbi:hypothetical protein [Streptomyces sp. MBT53]|uniref:hypothetical protein n=1 Tax=Streptomyces sp. MBT53 TaxID=1488384 RepID=UPI0035AC22D1
MDDRVSRSARASTARSGSTLAACASTLLIVQRVEAAVCTITSQCPDRSGGAGSLPMFQVVTAASGARRATRVSGQGQAGSARSRSTTSVPTTPAAPVTRVRMLLTVP